MTDGADDPNWIITSHAGRRGIYHSDESCEKLKRATNYREVSDGEIDAWDLRLCKCCEGYDRGTHGPSDASKLWHLDPDEVALDTSD